MKDHKQSAVAGPVEPTVRPTLVKCKDICKNVEYFLTGEFWPHANLKVRLKRWFPARDFWPVARGNGAIVESDNGMLFVIHPKGVVFASPMTVLSGNNAMVDGLRTDLRRGRGRSEIRVRNDE